MARGAEGTAKAAQARAPAKRGGASAAMAALLAVVLGVNLLCMPAVFQIGDPFAWREETKAILLGGLAVNSTMAARFGEPGQYFVLNEATGQWYSKYGIMNSLMSLPPTVAEWWLTGRLPGPLGRPDLVIFNLYQIALSLLVCAFLYRLTGWYSDRVVTRVAYVVAVFYTTFFWFYQRAQGAEIYQVLFFVGFFSCLMRYLRGLRDTRGDVGWAERRALVGAWLWAAALVFTRLLFGLLLVVVIAAAGAVIWGLGRDRWRSVASREMPFLAAPAVLLIVAVLWLDALKFGSPWLTGYHQWRPEIHVPSWSNWDGLYGLLFDMQGSVLWYFPVLIFAVLGLKRFYERYALDAIVMWASFAMFYLVVGKTSSWRGEWTYGPRYMLFALPVLGLPFLTFLDGLLDEPRRWASRVAGAIVAATLLYSAYLQERANRLDFFAYYRVSSVTEGMWTREVARHMLQRHLGAFCADLLRDGHDPDALPWVRELRRLNIPAEQMARVKQVVRALVSEENYYWKARTGA